MKKDQWLKELQAAAQKELVVEIDRDDLSDDLLRGFVIVANKELVMIQNLSDGVTLDGYTVVRTEDINRFREADADLEEFYLTALQIRGQKPSPVEGLSVESIAALLETVAGPFPLATIYNERRDSEECIIGQVVAVRDGEMALLGIDPAAEWDEDPDVYKLKDITRVEFGGSYEEALWLVAEKRSRENPD